MTQFHGLQAIGRLSLRRSTTLHSHDVVRAILVCSIWLGRFVPPEAATNRWPGWFIARRRPGRVVITDLPPTGRR